MQRTTRAISVEKKWIGESSDNDKDITITLYRKLNGQDDSQRVLVGTINLTKDSDWKYEWGSLPTSDKDGNAYVYSVEENSIPGYITTYDREINGPETELKQVWVKANSIQTGRKYLLVNKKTGQTLKDTSNEHDLSSSDTISLSHPITSVNGKKSGYLPQNDTAVLTAQSISGRRGLMMTRGNGHYLVGSYDSANGMQFSSKYGDSNDLNGFEYDGNRATLYSWDSEGPKGDLVTFFNNSFGISRKHTANPSYPVFYQLEDVEVPADRSVQPIKFTITNTKINYQLRVKKIDEADDSIKLEGAEFSLYQGTDLHVDPVQTGVTDSNGNLIFSNLEAGQYTLVETKAPEGYLLPENNSNTKQITIDLDTTNVDQNDSSIYFITIKIENELQVFELPETGGSGTELITYSGAALILASGGLYITGRKQRKKQSQ